MILHRVLSALRTWFTQNFAWKAVSILLAFFVWFFVLNVIDPITTATITVPLGLENEAALQDRGIHVQNMNELLMQFVTIQVRGSQSNIEEMRRTFAAWINLAAADIINMATEVGTLPVTIQHNAEDFSGIELVQISTLHIPLQLDHIVTQYIQVEVEIVGDVHTDYFLPEERVVVTPAYLEVRGPSMLIDTIGRMVTTINVEGMTESNTFRQRPGIAYSVGGERITNISLIGSVDVHVDVLRHGRLTILRPDHLGNPPIGFDIYEIDWEPRYFDVGGTSSEAIEALMPVRLALPLNVTETATQSFSHTFNLNHYLPDGIFLVNPSLHTIEVDVTIEPIITREFTIPVEDFTILGAPAYSTIATEQITLTISAMTPVIDSITQIVPTLRLGNLNLADGRHEVALTFSGIPARANILGDVPTVTIYVGHIEYTDVDDESAAIDGGNE